MLYMFRSAIPHDCKLPKYFFWLCAIWGHWCSKLTFRKHDERGFSLLGFLLLFCWISVLFCSVHYIHYWVRTILSVSHQMTAIAKRTNIYNNKKIWNFQTYFGCSFRYYHENGFDCTWKQNKKKTHVKSNCNYPSLIKNFYHLTCRQIWVYFLWFKFFSNFFLLVDIFNFTNSLVVGKSYAVHTLYSFCV